MGFFIDKGIVLGNKLPSNLGGNDVVVAVRRDWGWWRGTGHDEDCCKIVSDVLKRGREEGCLQVEVCGRRQKWWQASTFFLKKKSQPILGLCRVASSAFHHDSSHFDLDYMRSLHISEWRTCIRCRKYPIVSGHIHPFEIIFNQTTPVSHIWKERLFAMVISYEQSVMILSPSLIMAIAGRRSCTTNQTRSCWWFCINQPHFKRNQI